jgi:hypothetical protein
VVGIVPLYSYYVPAFLKSIVGPPCGIPVENLTNLWIAPPTQWKTFLPGGKTRTQAIVFRVQKEKARTTLGG